MLGNAQTSNSTKNLSTLLMTMFAVTATLPLTPLVVLLYGNTFVLWKMGHFDTSGDLKYGNLYFPYVGLLNIQKISISLIRYA
jgi:hypothetical protein